MNYVEFEHGEIKITTKNGYPQGWDHQYHGTACRQTTVHKKLVTLGYSTSKYFDPSWWYKLYHRFDDQNKPFVVEGVKSTGFAATEAEFKAQERALVNHPGKIYHSQLAQLIEAELNRLNPSYKNFRVLGELTEAYLEVSFDYKGKHENGYVLWENCD